MLFVNFEYCLDVLLRRGAKEKMSVCHFLFIFTSFRTHGEQNVCIFPCKSAAEQMSVCPFYAFLNASYLLRRFWGAEYVHFYLLRRSWGVECIHFYMLRRSWGAERMYF